MKVIFAWKRKEQEKKRKRGSAMRFWLSYEHFWLLRSVSNNLYPPILIGCIKGSGSAFVCTEYEGFGCYVTWSFTGQALISRPALVNTGVILCLRSTRTLRTHIHTGHRIATCQPRAEAKIHVAISGVIMARSPRATGRSYTHAAHKGIAVLPQLSINRQIQSGLNSWVRSRVKL